jgi:hypothetical protein
MTEALESTPFKPTYATRNAESDEEAIVHRAFLQMLKFRGWSQGRRSAKWYDLEMIKKLQGRSDPAKLSHLHRFVTIPSHCSPRGEVLQREDLGCVLLSALRRSVPPSLPVLG